MTGKGLVKLITKPHTFTKDYLKKKLSKEQLKEYIKKAIDLDVPSDIYYYFIFKELKKNKEILLAEEAIKKAIQKKEKVIYYHELVLLLKKKTQWKKLDDVLNSAIKFDNENTLLYYELGIVKKHLEQYEASLNFINKAIDLKKNNINAEWYYQLGYNFQKVGELNKSNKAYNQAIILDTQLNAKEYGIGIFHEKFGDLRKAINAYEDKLISMPYNDELALKLSILYRVNKNFLKEIKYIKQTIIQNYNKANLHFLLGRALENEKQYNDSILAYKNAISLEKNNKAYWYFRLGCVLFQSKDYQAASSSFLQIFNINQSSDIEIVKYGEVLLSDIDLNIIDIYDDTQTRRFIRTLIHLKKFDKALELLHTLSEFTKVDYYDLAYIYHVQCEYEVACNYFKKVDVLEGFKKRIKKEFKIDLIDLELDYNRYKFTFKIVNNSKINSLFFVEELIIKHRQRVGNENTEFSIQPSHVTVDSKSIICTFEFNPENYLIPLHYWDFYLTVKVQDNNYSSVNVQVPVERVEGSLLSKINKKPLTYATFSQENILYPYVTVGNKVSFLKRPKTIYDDNIYLEREAEALKEFEAQKDKYLSKKSWMIYEKFSKTAQDNGYYFFKYAVQKRPNVYYVIEKDSPDREKLEEYGDSIVEFMSKEHMLLVLSAEMMISSETRPHAYAWRRTFGSFQKELLLKKYVFLQHGVTALKQNGNVFSKLNRNFAAEKFVVTSNFEKQIVMDAWHYSEKDMIVSGFARWDGFIDKSNEYQEIFLMPTWRNWLEDISDEDFIQTDYYYKYKNFLTSSHLEKLLEKHNYKLNFYLHPKIIQHLNKFTSHSKRIALVDFGDLSVRELLMRSKILITDYSSVAWDFIFLGKPVLFYHFDVNKYKELQGAYIDLEKDIPGEVVHDEHSLLKLLNDVLEKYEHSKDKAVSYKKEYFKEIENNVCETIYKNLISKERG